MAVKQAHLADAYVLGTASSVNVELIKCLGVNEMIDFRMHDFSILCDIFLVIDSLGGQTLEKSWSVLRSGGHIAGLMSFDIQGRKGMAGESVFFASAVPYLPEAICNNLRL
ncbi:hypothetical protein ML100_003578 [Klebsiella pneumoniae]|uniref:hypothetical protein n=1 Tax=Klebsiella TaxID=570 RepID=UPI000E0E31C9|nr:hypothetical protein [Klebsiella pneumoniae]HBQ5717442.1 hypothetical protein [Klebsiella pneumoniae subsp. pneumoniae]EIX9656598.1 hypothetical protein [Klebsiella pneumoniae]EIX9673436.1 hypothetical protein [Klebsiella pneumoniae]EJC6280523.1 hypothetical protein [Klebsiella pneumoniae]EJC6286708.1 hypothetical protein [Klebsiella pneumoniae]